MKPRLSAGTLFRLCKMPQVCDSERIKLLLVSYHSQQIPFKFMGLLWLLNLSHSQSSWLQRCDCGGGHYGSALGLEMTRVTDDIRKPHSPRQSLPNFSNRNEVAELAECLLGLPSFSSELLLSKGHFFGLQIKSLPAAIREVE